MSTLTKRSPVVIMDPYLRLGEIMRARMEIEVKPKVVPQPLRINLLEEFGDIYAAKEYETLDGYLDLCDKWSDRMDKILREGLLCGRKIVISFKGIKNNPELFYRSICKLYHEFPVDRVDSDIKVIDNESNDGEDTLARCREGTKRDIKDPRAAALRRRTTHKIMGDEDDIPEEDKTWLKYELTEEEEWEWLKYTN
jgi:hypothetical protein